MKKSLILMLLLATFLFTAGNAFALIYSFDGITNNNPTDVATGEAQLFMDVTQVNNQVQFLFSNTGPKRSSITDIYFDDPIPLLLFQSLTNATGVAFSPGARPRNLPGGNDISFSSDHAYDSDAPRRPNGVNPGEWVSILFNIADTYDFADVLAQLNDSSLIVGIHVQGFLGGGSESFINNPGDTEPIPEPGTLVLLGAGFFALAIYKRRTAA